MEATMNNICRDTALTLTPRFIHVVHEQLRGVHREFMV